MKTHRQCLTCQFIEAGLCKRNPPQMVLWPSDNQHPIMYVPSASWPNVNIDDWCGEWRLKRND